MIHYKYTKNTSEVRDSTIRTWKEENTADPYYYEKVLVLESAANPFSSLWQHVLPNNGLKQTMTDSEFHTTCRLQLLLPIMEGVWHVPARTST